MHAVVALLLLVLMPLGQLHRSSTGACRLDHRAALAGSVATAGNVGVDAATSVLVEHERTVIGDQHDHRSAGLAAHGAAPSACGPAALAERPESRRVPRSQDVVPGWRALSPLALAAPPPAPPPRLS